MREDKKCVELFRKHTYPWVLLGLVAAFVSVLPYIILGERAIVTYMDQLDGELITYLLNAKHLFSGAEYYEEIANGISVNGMVSPAPGLIILFRLFSPYTAYVISLFFKQAISVCFSFLLFNELTGKKVLSFSVALFFMFLPFYAVYGLSIPGQVMLVYALIRLGKDKNPLWDYFSVFVYALFSSLPLGGFMVIVDLGILFIVMLIYKKKPLRYFISECIVCLVYALENINLVKQMLGMSEGFVSHKSEWHHYSTDSFLAGVKYALWDGDYYIRDYHTYYVVLILFGLIVAGLLLCKKKDTQKIEKEIKALFISAGYLVFISILIGFYTSPAVTELVNQSTGVLHDFNFTRILWTGSTAWVISLAVSISIVYEWIITLPKNEKVVRRLYCICVGGIMCLSLFMALNENDLKYNLTKMIKKDYYMLSWEQFYAEDLFDQVEEVIGLPKEDYRVVSYGIYPSVAAYNGFYCLDMYSNNYDVEYKHKFRRIIASELEKSEYQRSYFDDWGNRCYIIQDSTGFYCTFEKRWTPYSQEFNLDFDALREMGCHYLISASYIIEPERYGLTLLNENAAIESENSWYWIFVYKF